MATAKEMGRMFSSAREKLKITIEEASQKCRIYTGTIRDIENGVFDKLNKLYLKSFIKKYASFLGLDVEKLIKEYESISSAIPIKAFNPNIGLQKEKAKVSFPTVFTAERLTKAATIFLLGLLIALLFVLAGVVKSSLVRMREGKGARVTEARETSKKSASSQEAASVRAKPAATAQVILTLRARGEVWVQVNDSQKILFAGTLREGDSRTLKSDLLIVQTGRADMLDFFINTRKIGVIASGVVKNIKISSLGIQIGDNWIARY